MVCTKVQGTLRGALACVAGLTDWLPAPPHPPLSRLLHEPPNTFELRLLEAEAADLKFKLAAAEEAAAAERQHAAAADRAAGAARREASERSQTLEEALGRCAWGCLSCEGGGSGEGGGWKCAAVQSLPHSLNRPLVAHALSSHRFTPSSNSHKPPYQGGGAAGPAGLGGGRAGGSQG